MKTIQTLILSIFAVAILSSCETTGSGEAGYSFPEPNQARTAQEVQSTHNKILRQNY